MLFLKYKLVGKCFKKHVLQGWLTHGMDSLCVWHAADEGGGREHSDRQNRKLSNRSSREHIEH